MIDKSFLQRRQVPRCAQSFDGGNFPAEGGIGDRHPARAPYLPVYQHGTGTAFTTAAAELCPGEPEVVAQHPEEGLVQFGCYLPDFTIDVKCEIFLSQNKTPKLVYSRPVGWQE